MADSDALIAEIHGDVRYLMNRVSEMDKNMGEIARTLDRINTNLEWHFRVGRWLAGAHPETVPT